MSKVKIQIYDPAMCCSSGVCGPSVDEKLLRLQETILELSKNYADKVEVQRFMISAQPFEFMNNTKVAEILQNEGADQLPLVFVDGNLISQKGYPTKEEIMSYIK
ncbi:hypothetical protein BHU72_10185 [Desulfuribacillus stibiiarsenatis]|uniref:Uncharacterized protein n=1 Tax=Desulfuribacillus stibiiarsenatis TaxID=1390249 RepID=A0A1E5L8Z0_9FIRM|nr:arsenite efflux transporter metallochaperone ArsD [Desulfuribacillus stibiiarsenatis]OEH86615.1 hypothetical protein BHU72_10185 [Desulfuribacillus stibiiarsenatis]